MSVVGCRATPACRGAAPCYGTSTTCAGEARLAFRQDYVIREGNMDNNGIRVIRALGVVVGAYQRALT